MKLHQYLTITILLAALLLAMSWVGFQEAEMARDDRAMYCEMVQLWKDSNGQKGWPAYQGEEVCK
jgi:hypothetical protein